MTHQEHHPKPIIAWEICPGLLLSSLPPLTVARSLTMGSIASLHLNSYFYMPSLPRDNQGGLETEMIITGCQ